MKELLNNIGITRVGHFDNKHAYVVEFETDAEYNKAFSKLDKSDLLEENPDASSVTLDTSIVVYESDDYVLTLLANFNENRYELQVKELKG